MTNKHQENVIDAGPHRGFSIVELMIAMLVFTVILGAVVTLLVKSQTIFRREQGVSEMDQNARLLMDFLTRDIQQSKENGLGLGARFRSIYSYDGAVGKTDEITVVSAETESLIPAAALPLVPASTRAFSASDQYLELVPNGQGHLKSADVASTLAVGEEFIISSTRQDGSLQFDFIKAKGVKLTKQGLIGLSFEPAEHKGVQPEVAYGSDYEDGNYTLRPVTLKRYFIDKTDKEHPALAMSINGGPALQISRNVVAFQLRYLEVAEGELDGQWVNQQSISSQFKTIAVEVTATARTEIDNDKDAGRLVTLASVIRPREVPTGDFGSSPGSRSPSIPTGGWDDPGGNGGPGGPGGRRGAPGDDGFGGPGGGSNSDAGSGDGLGFGQGGYRHQTRRVGKQPRLGERLNPR
jgi:prepilin-type N-terminal cleavage/methylation domain-containing protein